MTRVVAGSRLHFGLLHVPVEGVTHWPDGTAVRRFGGVGLMVREPAVEVSVEPAAEWSGDGPHADRALRFAQRFVRETHPGEPTRFRVSVGRCPPEHVGLGVGTQIGMAVARALAGELDAVMSTADLARGVGRGERSGIGVHGSASGGFLIDGGKVEKSAVGSSIIHRRFPDDWPVVLVRPAQPGRWHGPAERSAFARPRDADALFRSTERLCRLALVGILPAIVDRDLTAFGAAVTAYNRLAGEFFAADQGGAYASAEVGAMVAALTAAGAAGAGQSSWGPTVWAFARDHRHALRLADETRRRFPNADGVTITTARNTRADYVKTI